MGAKELPTPGFDAHYREINLLDEHVHRQTSTVKVFRIEALWELYRKLYESFMGALWELYGSYMGAL